MTHIMHIVSNIRKFEYFVMDTSLLWKWDGLIMTIHEHNDECSQCDKNNAAEDFSSQTNRVGGNLYHVHVSNIADFKWNVHSFGD